MLDTARESRAGEAKVLSKSGISTSATEDARLLAGRSAMLTGDIGRSEWPEIERSSGRTELSENGSMLIRRLDPLLPGNGLMVGVKTSSESGISMSATDEAELLN